MYHIIVQHQADKLCSPSSAQLRKWAKSVLAQQNPLGAIETEVTIRIVDSEEMSQLNSTYRQKIGPTNVLSFPFDMPQHASNKMIMLGDIVICADVVNREAEEQHKSEAAHWAHMIVHGMYHLLGYDHQTEAEAQVMEALEINMLQSLHFPNPYESGANRHHD